MHFKRTPDLLRLLRGKVLPILMAAAVPLAPKQLAGMAGAALDKVHAQMNE